MKDLLKKYKKTVVGVILTVATVASMLITGYVPTFQDAQAIFGNFVSGDHSANTQKVEDILNALPKAE